MALFGYGKDITFFRGVNRELINDIIQSEVDILKLSIENSNANIYGESVEKKYTKTYRIACLISTEDQDTRYNEFGPDVNQGIKFSFIRDFLKELDVVIEVGDLVHWNNEYWEIDGLIENKLFMKRNPETNKTIGEDFGWDVAITAVGHNTKINLVNLERSRS